MDWNFRDYLRPAQEYIVSGGLHRDEGYKLDIVKDLEGVRAALLSGDDTWPAQLKRTLRRRDFGRGIPGAEEASFNLIDWRVSDLLVRWFTSRPAEARPALLALWADTDTSPGDRIRGFIARAGSTALPPSGVGTRLRPISALALALGPAYPPFQARAFRQAYLQTGFPHPPKDADEGQVYEHALRFLDGLLESRKTLGMERPAHRLDAQGIVWWYNWAGPEQKTP